MQVQHSKVFGSRTVKTLNQILAAGAILFSTVAQARDDRLTLPIKVALEEGKNKGVISDDIKLFFGKGGPEPKTKLGTFTSNRKTNAVGKSDVEACNWVFLSAVKQLQERARSEGGNAVINIRSVYKGANSEDSDNFICGAGNIMAGVALEGTVAKL
jgi:hypothetical protein